MEERDFAIGDPASWRERGCPTERRVAPVHYRIMVPTLAEAQGIHFICPKCFAQNHGPVGTHWCEVAFDGRGVAPEDGSHDEDGKPTRWQIASGNGIDDLTLMPSIWLKGGCGWHGYITKGEAT